jgi:hypothetical protein
MPYAVVAPAKVRRGRLSGPPSIAWSPNASASLVQFQVSNNNSTLWQAGNKVWLWKGPPGGSQANGIAVTSVPISTQNADTGSMWIADPNGQGQAQNYQYWASIRSFDNTQGSGAGGTILGATLPGGVAQPAATTPTVSPTTGVPVTVVTQPVVATTPSILPMLLLGGAALGLGLLLFHKSS